jgi:hypothetical protein
VFFFTVMFVSTFHVAIFFSFLTNVVWVCLNVIKQRVLGLFSRCAGTALVVTDCSGRPVSSQYCAAPMHK